MNVALWIAQALLTLLFVAAGAPKVLRPRARLAERMSWTRDASDLEVKGLGALELLGAVGLIAPRAAGVAPALTPVAAGCLALLMAGAVAVKRRAGESPALPMVAGLGALFVSVGRFGLIP